MEHTVTEADTAVALGSGEVDVLATPRLIAWLEGASVEAARPHLVDGRTTVGTSVTVKHRRPTGVGATVTTTAEVTSGPDDKGRLTFAVRAVDADGELVGDGEIGRVVVDRGTFGAT